MKKFICKISIFIIFFIVFNYVFVWFYETPLRRKIKQGTYVKQLKWNDIHQYKNYYDIVILGSSRAYCSYNPVIIDSVTNLHSYNMGTGSQNITETYYMLKEIFKYQKPKFVIYEIFLPSFKNTPDYFHVFTNAKFMSKNSKYDMIFNGFGKEGIANILLPALKYIPYLKNNLSDIFKPENQILDNTKWIKGYAYSNDIADSLTTSKFPPISNFYNTKVSSEWIENKIKSLKKICQKNNAKIIFVRAPYPPVRLAKTLNDTVHKYFDKISRKYKIPFYDFNYQLKSTYKNTDFQDKLHMNYSGASKVSKQLGLFIINH